VKYTWRMKRKESSMPRRIVPLKGLFVEVKGVGRWQPTNQIWRWCRP
jgi:hypothetical protein